MKQNYEFGRSMVEMLGTLAIVGVLSIGGITGYNYAINKYRANETINEINMRLMTLQTQSERDMDLNLNEFADKTSLGYTIGDNYGWAEDDTRVYVGVSGIPKQACEIIYDEMISRVERIDITADRTADINTLCGDNNEMKFYVGSGVEVACDPACADDEYCMSGIKCVKKWKDEHIKCTPGDNTPCGECMTCHGFGMCTPKNNGKACDGGNGICLSGVCTPLENSCSEHSDCPDGYYCSPKPGLCDSEKEGYKCAPLDFSYYPVKLSDGTTELWYKSNQYMYWQNAMAACEALDKIIPTVAEWRKLPQIKDLPGDYWTSSKDSQYCNMAYIMNSSAPWQAKNLDIAYALCR